MQYGEMVEENLPIRSPVNIDSSAAETLWVVVSQVHYLVPTTYACAAERATHAHCVDSAGAPAASVSKRPAVVVVVVYTILIGVGRWIVPSVCSCRC